jgi:UDP-N-acetylmuramyl pentapeptide synthase
MFLNGDDMLLHGLMGLIDRPIVYYGIDENLDVVGSDIKLKGDQGFEFEFQWQQRGYKAVVRIAGAHNVYNALAAVAVGLQSEVRPEQIVEALGEYRPDRMRMNITNAGDVKLINDAYNANPQSVQAAIDVLAGLDAKSRRIAALGDMLELGETSGQYHRQMGAYAASKNIDLIVSVGRYARDVAEGAIEAGAAWAAGVPGAGGGAPDSANAVIGSGAGTGAGTGIAAAEISAGGSGAEEKSAATGAGAGAGASNAGAVSTCAAKCAAFGDKREAGEYLLRTITAGDVVLIKGSRATAMESIADSISESAARLGTGAGAMPAAPLPTHSGGLEIYD